MVGVLLQNPLSIRCNVANLHFLPLRSPKFTTFKLLYSNVDLSAESSSKSDAVVTLFHEYGFSSDQVEWILSKRRNLLTAESRIKPKLDYLLSSGYSQPELIKLICTDPNILTVSLERRLVRNLDLLKTLLGSEELVKKCIRRFTRLLNYDLEKRMLPNVETLRASGVPSELIVYAVSDVNRAIVHNPDAFLSVVEQIRNLGFDPCSRKFVEAIQARTQSGWDKKMKLYESLGWSEQIFFSAFLKYPHCMLNSEQKIRKMMGFYVEKLGWDPVFLSEQPLFIAFSLERRIIPRCSVLNVLAERGLLGGELELHRIFVLHESLFEAQYVTMREDQAPGIIEVYQNSKEEDFKALRSWQQRNNQTAILPKKKSEIIPISIHKTCEDNEMV